MANTIICTGCANCQAVTRMQSMLKFYNNNYNNFKEIGKYLAKYKNHIIGDYHHILDKHLNRDNISQIDSNKQFELIHQQMTGISCDIENCKIYSRNNRQRETTNIECKDEKVSMFIDIIDTIHCYFLHSIDIGYRIVNHQLYQQNESKNNDDEDDIQFDAEMKRLREYITLKRKKLQKIRGDRRINNNKFMTQLTGNPFI